MHALSIIANCIHPFCTHHFSCWYHARTRKQRKAAGKKKAYTLNIGVLLDGTAQKASGKGMHPARIRTCKCIGTSIPSLHGVVRNADTHTIAPWLYKSWPLNHFRQFCTGHCWCALIIDQYSFLYRFMMFISQQLWWLVQCATLCTALFVRRQNRIVL